MATLARNFHSKKKTKWKIPIFLLFSLALEENHFPRIHRQTVVFYSAFPLYFSLEEEQKNKIKIN